MKKKLKILLIGALIFCMGISIVHTVNVNADEGDNEEEYLNSDVFIALDKDGNITQVPLDKLETPDENQLSEIQDVEYQVVRVVDGKQEVIETVETKKEADKIVEQYQRKRAYNNGTISSIVNPNTSNGVVVFKYTGSTIDYRNADTGISGYLATSYGPDAAYLGMQNGQVKFKLSGVTGLVNADQVYVVDYDAFVAKGLKTNTYTTSQGKLYHNITTDLASHQSTQLVGYQQSYMTNNATYYSYDGHYFYTDYKQMLTDYKNNKHTGAINPNNPYYSYYQYLTHRTKTGFTAAQINEYINAKSASSSKLRGLGEDFIKYQNTYGANAILMLGVAINESAFGTSKIAREKNNLFGHGAVDSNPYYGANGYATPGDSVKYHAEMFLSNGYLDVLDWRYFGAQLGDKESGMIKYASDPYWGEKAAARGYYIEEYFNKQTYDYGKYKVGVTSGNVSIYQEATNNSSEQYSTGNSDARGYRTNDVSVVILGEVTGKSINGNNKWYKVQTDTPLTDSRNLYKRDRQYNFDRDYGYIHSANVRVINMAQTPPVPEPKPEPEPTPPPTPTYLKGDVNGDGKVNSLDYVQIENHIMGRKILVGESLKRADVNNDGKVSSLDYVQIENHIMGRKPLF